MPEAPAIEARGLSKTYPNGAGKSTTIRLLLDLIRPTGGSAAILAQDTRSQSVEARRRIGYLPGDLRLNDRLTGHEQLESLARMRESVDPAIRDSLVERFECVLDRPIRELSKGNRQKLGIVQAFMHRPEVLILDEPTGGLDPINQGEFRSLTRETAADGRTVFLSSHSLEEVQRTADRVGIIRAGRLIDVDSVASLRERSLRQITIRFRDAVETAVFGAIDGVRIQKSEDRSVRLTAPEPAMDAIVKAAAGHHIVDFVAEPADLEEIFLELYRENDGSG